MAFEHLDYGRPLDHAFTLAYKFTDDWSETWSGRFARFKEKDQKALYGAAKVLKPAMVDLFATAKLDPKRTVIVPALASAETTADPKRHIPLLAAAVSKTVGCRLDMTSVTKDPHPSLHKVNAAERIQTLEKANYKAKAVDADTVLILDDFITQGATLGITARKLKEANPDLAVLGAALGKTERLAYWNGFGVQLTNSHVPKPWDGLWLEGEQFYVKKAKSGA
jgi:predicted amidophosphoribosyltransferase